MSTLIQLSGTAPLADLRFRSACIQEGLSENSQADLQCESARNNLNPSDFLGKTVCLGFETRERQQRYFDAVIVQMELASSASSGHCLYRFELRSWTWLLSRNQDFRVYQRLHVIDIVAEVIGRQSHAAVRFEDRTTQAHRVWEYCVQFDESDLNFIRRILEQEGIYFYFEHTLDQHTLVLLDSNSAHTPYVGYEALLFDPAAGLSSVLEQERIQSLGMRHSIEPPRHAHTDYNFKTPGSSLLQTSVGVQESHNSAFEVFEYPGDFEDAGQGQIYSEFRHQEQLSRSQVYQGKTQARGVCTGYLLSTVCTDNPILQRSLLITSTRLVLQESSSEASNSGLSGFSCEFEGIESSRQFRANRVSRKPHVRGPLPALVVGPAGREIHTDEYGRIKVQFHWDRYGQRDENSSCWVRVAYPAAGKGWGVVSIPRIGQEVWVSFEDGDPDRPLVTGVNYNADQVVPYLLPDNKTVSGWRTQSTEGGEATNFNELRFEDKKGAEYIRFQAERDYMGLIKNQSQLEIGADSHLLIHGSLLEEIKKDVSRKVLGAVMQHIKQSVHIQIDDDCLASIEGLLSLNSKAGMAISTSGPCSVKSSGSTNIQSGGNLNQSTAGACNLSASTTMRLSVGGSSITLSPSGIFINGPLVSVNGSGGGAAAPAVPANPEVPVAPEPAVPPIDPLA